MFVAGIQQLPAVCAFFLSASLSPGFLLPTSISFLLPCCLDTQGLNRFKGLCSDRRHILFLEVFAPYTSPNLGIIMLEREGQTLI